MPMPCNCQSRCTANRIAAGEFPESEQRPVAQSVKDSTRAGTVGTQRKPIPDTGVTWLSWLPAHTMSPYGAGHVTISMHAVFSFGEVVTLLTGACHTRGHAALTRHSVRQLISRFGVMGGQAACQYTQNGNIFFS